VNGSIKLAVISLLSICKQLQLWSFDPEKNVSSPEDIILSEHVEEYLPHELCDIP
jgi:hypothetical protein